MGKLKLTFFDKLMLLVSLFAAVALVLGALAGNYDPRSHVLIAFIGLAYPYVLLGNLLLLFWWVVRKKWLFVFILFAVILSGKSTLNATFKFFGNTEPSGDTAGLLRLMTYNVHNFKEFGSDNSVEVKRKMLDVIKEQHPDVICFQEFYSRYKGEFDVTDSIKQMLKTPYYYFVPSSKNKYEAIGLAIFSKYPIRNKAYISLQSKGGNGVMYVDISFNNKLLRVYNIHLRSISFEAQDYEYIDKVKEINPDKQSSKRIYRMLRAAFQKRAEHVDVMKAELKNCKIPYIIAGDFNDTPASYAVNQLTGKLNSAFTAQGKGLGCTYNGKFPNFQIDYIASTKDIDVMSYKITEAKLSDHFPVRADLKFK